MTDNICNENCLKKDQYCDIGSGYKKYQINKNGDLVQTRFCYHYSTEMRKNSLLKNIGNVKHIGLNDLNYSNIEVMVVNNVEFRGEFYHVLLKLIDMIKKGRNIWLYGATGTGKTTIGFALLYKSFLSDIKFQYLDGFKYCYFKSILPEKYMKCSGITLIDEVYSDQESEKLLLKYIEWEKIGVNPIIFTSNYAPYGNAISGTALSDQRVIDRLQLIPVLVITKQSYRRLNLNETNRV